jgi:S1-C subfamily serine protease
MSRKNCEYCLGAALSLTLFVPWTIPAGVCAEEPGPNQNLSDNPQIAAPSPSLSAAIATMPLGPNTIADVAQTVAPSVVSLKIDKDIVATRMLMPNGATLRYFFNGQQINPGQLPPVMRQHFQSQNMGSGFIVRPDGYIVTNNHVVKDSSKITVTLNDGRSLEGKVVGTDPFSDIAIVKVEATDLPVARFGDTKTLRPGDFVIAIGSPMGFDHTVTFGIISALGRSIDKVNKHISLIQTDAAINPGNSGGPLLNLSGDVIGVNVAIQANAQNLGFSIPVDIVRSVSDAIIAHKPIERPWLGLVMDPSSEARLKALNLPAATRGVFIATVPAGTPAEKAGILAQDIVQKVDGVAVSTPKEVQRLVLARRIGDTLKIQLLRQNVAKTVDVVIGHYPLTVENSNTPEE